MKCQICKNKTTWDESIGYDNFIVCPKCYEAIKDKFGKDSLKAADIIFTLGKIKRKNQKKTAN